VPLKAREVESALIKKGFKKSDRDHHFFFFWYKGRKTAIRTKISHAESEIHDKNCSSMARQIGLNRNEFNNFVACPLTEELDIEKLTKEKHLIAPLQPEQANKKQHR
jgi:predicted RNA binding protein YcfA (HicA-like mRNA interferase family)